MKATNELKSIQLINKVKLIAIRKGGYHTQIKMLKYLCDEHKKNYNEDFFLNI